MIRVSFEFNTIDEVRAFLGDMNGMEEDAPAATVEVLPDKKKEAKPAPKKEAKPDPKKEVPATETTPVKSQAMTALRRVFDELGFAPASRILTEDFGVTRFAEVQIEDYGKLVEVCNEILTKHGK